MSMRNEQAELRLFASQKGDLLPMTDNGHHIHAHTLC
jgi:hypothetical protein